MLYISTTEQIANARNALVLAIDERARWEVTRNPAENDAKAQKNLDSKLRYLNRFRTNCERVDAFALGYLASNPLSFDDIFRSHRRVTDAFNIYAMPKCLIIATCLNGGSIDHTQGGDNLTIAAVILEMARGETMQAKLAHAIDMLAHSHGNITYNSGATQASSTLRALEAFGIVRKSGKLGLCQLWDIGNAVLFARMTDASNGKRAASVPESLDAATQQTSGSATERDRGAARHITMASATPPASVQEGDASATPATVTQEAETPRAPPAKAKGGKGKGKGKGKASDTPAIVTQESATMESDALHVVPCDVLTMARDMVSDDDTALAMIDSANGSAALPDNETMF